MTAVIMIMAMLTAAVVQTVAPASPLLGQVKAPALLAVVIYYALNRGTVVMVCAAFLAGFFQDALSLIPLGYSAAVFVPVGWLIGRYRKLVNTESPATSLFFGAIVGSVVTLVLSLLLMRAGLARVTPWHLLVKGVGGGLLCMLTTLVVFLLLGSIERMVGNVRMVHEVGGTDEY